MANHKSAKKRIRQNNKRREQNRTARSTVRTAIKNTQKLVAEGKLDEAKTQLAATEAIIARAGAKNLYHGKNASRKISRLVQFVKKAS